MIFQFLKLKSKKEDSEFKKTSEEDIKYLQDLNINSNTAHSTQTWLRRFSKWADERGLISDS